MLALLLALPAADFPNFVPQEIATDLSIGYAVLTPDLNGDGKPDILVVDQHRVVWYENPTWKPRVILNGKTAPDNVCAAVADLDGDGQLDIVLGAGWKPTDTRTPGTLQWLRRGKTLDDEWTLFPIPCDEPTVHRIRVTADRHLVVAPLHGRDCTAKGNWTDGRTVRLLRYPLPKDPTDPAAWTPEVLPLPGYTVHNFTETPGGHLLVGKHGGLAGLVRVRDGWDEQNLGWATRGASEVAIHGDIVDAPADTLTATVEPWHGNTVVAYAGPKRQRVLLDDRLRWGHAIKLADLDGDGRPDLIAVGRQTKNLKIYWNRKP